MRSPNEFWMRLHELSRAYDAEGETSHKRQENIVSTFEEMPRIAQHEVFAEMARIMTSLQEIYPEVLGVLADAKAPAPEPEQRDRSA
jgi:hypothetical protein